MSLTREWLPSPRLIVLLCGFTCAYVWSSRTAENESKPVKVANPGRDQLSRIDFLPYSRLRVGISFRQTGLVVPSRVSFSFSTVVLKRVLTCGIPPAYRHGVHLFIPSTAIESVPRLSGNSIAYRWHLLPKCHRQRVSSRQGSSRNECFPIRYQ